MQTQHPSAVLSLEVDSELNRQPNIQRRGHATPHENIPALRFGSQILRCPASDPVYLTHEHPAPSSLPFDVRSRRWSAALERAIPRDRKREYRGIVACATLGMVDLRFSQRCIHGVVQCQMQDAHVREMAFPTYGVK